MKISQLAIRVIPLAWVCALPAASVPAAEAFAPSNAPQSQHHHVTPPPKPIVATEVVPGIPEADRAATEQGKGRARGFDTRRHRLPNGEYIRD